MYDHLGRSKGQCYRVIVFDALVIQVPNTLLVRMLHRTNGS
jgi:hypothetical protein